jgi:hypothetical protein
MMMMLRKSQRMFVVGIEIWRKTKEKAWKWQFCYFTRHSVCDCVTKRVHHTQCTENCEFCSQFDFIAPQRQGRNCNCNLAHSHFRHFNSF